MTDLEIFNAAIRRTDNPDTRARLEVAREYFTNPPFRRALEDETWRQSERYWEQMAAAGGEPIGDGNDHACCPHD